MEVVGDISESLCEILRCARRTEEPEFALALRKTMEAERAAMAADDSCPMKPARILADVRSVMGREDILGEDCYVDFTNPDFKMLAEAMHCKGYRVEKAEDLIPHTGRSVPAECAQRHRGAGGLQ